MLTASVPRSGANVARRVPFEPLGQAIERACALRAMTENAMFSPTVQRNIANSRLSGTIGWVQADRICVSLGLHPVQIWPDWYELTEDAS